MSALFLLAGLIACSGADADSEPAPIPEVIPADLAASTWQVAVAEPGELDTMASSPGWRSRYGWDLPASAAAFAVSSDPGAGAALARIHAEMGALYRQAALIQANAIVETYRPEQRRAGDPAEVEYLLGVAYVIRGELESARAHLGRSGDSAVPGLADADAAWAERVAADDFVLSLSDDPRLFPLPAVRPGETPSPPPAPHYAIPETIGALSVSASDPTVTLQLAMWHRAAAERADPASADAVLAPWLLPLDPPATAGPVGLGALFLGPWPTSGDLVYAATGSPGEGSVFAAALAGCGAGAPDLYCVQEAGSGLYRQLQAAMAQAGGGAQGDHRALARAAQLGLLRLASRLASSAGDIEGGARLMVSALDLVSGAEADPLFLMKVSAWDTSHRNTLRAQDLLHGQVSRLPGLDAARVSLDALALRVSRDAGPAVPMH